MSAASFDPDLTILSGPQRRLWEELSSVPSFFTLYGGTAIALHLGHRESIDFDFFGEHDFNPDDLMRSVSFLSAAEIVQRSAGGLTARLDRGGGVLISFFATPELGRVEAPAIAPGNGLRIARLLDLAGMKADVVQKRAEAKDYVDLDALIARGTGLPQALSAARAIQGPSFNPLITLKALSYFNDGNLVNLPPALQQRLRGAVREVDVELLPVLAPLDKPFGAARAQ